MQRKTQRENMTASYSQLENKDISNPDSESFAKSLFKSLKKRLVENDDEITERVIEDKKMGKW